MDSSLHPGDEAFEAVDPLEGTICELRQYESVFNSKGERVLLQMGARRRNRNINRDNSSKFSALVQTKFWDKDQDTYHTELDIQSPYMKSALKTCVPEYANLDIEHRSIILKDEPRCIFHYRLELGQYREICLQNYEMEAAAHVEYLISYMASNMMSEVYIFNMMADINIPDPAIDFPNLWMVFVPGDMVCVGNNIHSSNLSETIVKFKSMSRCSCTRPMCQNSTWRIVVHSIVSNGKDFGHETMTLKVNPFDGFRALADMPVMPLKYHPSQEAIKQKVMARGRKYRKLAIGFHHMNYQGPASLIYDVSDDSLSYALTDDGMAARKSSVESRIMLDSDAFSNAIPDASHVFDLSQKIFKTDTNHHMGMTDEELMICEDNIEGFSLNDMKWGRFKVDLIEEVHYNNNAFQALIFDQDDKDMILSLVKVHTEESTRCDDIIAGKGKGMIFLLHGEPGTGKTLTAESVADYTKKPLYRLHAGILGPRLHEVDENLSKSLNLATKWDAVALLDEADVFLEQRDSINLERNFLVTAFLRVLEYYQGILFLTTNRIRVFDEAFKSRVHFTIRYPALDSPSRQRLWELFISRLPNNIGASLIEGGDLKLLDDDGLNGRQIKNIVRTAHALAISKGEATLGLDYLRKALKTVKVFDNNRDLDGTVTDDSEATRAIKRRRID